MAVTAAPNHFSVSMSWELCKDLKRKAKPEAGAPCFCYQKVSKTVDVATGWQDLGLSFWGGQQLASDPGLSLCTLVPADSLLAGGRTQSPNPGKHQQPTVPEPPTKRRTSKSFLPTTPHTNRFSWKEKSGELAGA